MRRATKIDWETDGMPARLPNSIDIPDEVFNEDIGDYLSNQIGWLVNSFEIEDVFHD